MIGGLNGVWSAFPDEFFYRDTLVVSLGYGYKPWGSCCGFHVPHQSVAPRSVGHRVTSNLYYGSVDV